MERGWGEGGEGVYGVFKTLNNGGAVCYYHVTYAFQSESTHYSCLNVKELIARNRRHI